MSMLLEFNWYLVINEEPIRIDDGYVQENFTLKEEIYYRIKKDEARIYPVGGVVPLIRDDQAIAMVHIRECSQRLGVKNQIFTVVDYDIILEFRENDPVAHHYTDLYLAYKKQQEVKDHGGKFKTEEFVNALERRSFEEIVSKLGGEADVPPEL